MMMKIRFPLVCLLVAVLLLLSEAAAREDVYLKEMLEGRCYEAPPFGEPSDCPTTVSSSMGILEGKLDSEIQVNDFDGYVTKADFSSPKDKALFWLHFMGSSSSSVVVNPPSDLVTPEDTPGGALFKGLLFCGTGVECKKKEESKAYWSFWQAAYGEFASQASGHVQIVVEPMADVNFLLRSAVGSLKVGQVTSITIYGMDQMCHASKGINKLMDALSASGFGSITCDDDVTNLLTNGRTSTTTATNAEETTPVTTTTTEEDEKEEPNTTKKRRHPGRTFFKWLLFLAIVIVAVWYLYTKGYIPSHWLSKLGYERVKDDPYAPGDRLPLSSVDDNDKENKGVGNGMPQEKVVIH